MDPQPSAPPVVAVVVTCNPGFWLEDTLASLGDQDYPNLSVLVIDAASTHDPTPRVAAVLPGAYVRRLPARTGFSRAANEVLEIVEGASHYLFCHDDVAPAPDAVRVLVEEAFRSNAAIVSPKFVDWHHPDRLLAVGQSADKTGVLADLVDRGELDQEQHDSVRDVFCAPGGCILVRADLFASLGGFDPGIDLMGEDLNLSWRTQVAGARVVVAPGVRVRHLEALHNGEREGWDDPGASRRALALLETHRVRTMLTCYSLFHLLRVVPQALILSAGQAAVELVTGRPGVAAGSLLAWPKALADPARLLVARRSVQRHRTVGDGEVRRLQARGSAKIRTFLRSTIEGEDHATPASTGRNISARLASKTWRLPAAAWAVAIVVLLVGSRGLIRHALPSVGTIPVTGGGPTAWWRLWWSAWRPGGLGSSGPQPPGLALLGLAGTVLVGGVGVLQKLVVLGPLVVGPLGAYRAARPLGSSLGRAAALVTYAAVGLPYNALAGGQWPGLVVYAAAPWVLSSLCRFGGEGGLGGVGGRGGQDRTRSRSREPAQVVGLGLLVALTAAFAPAFLIVVPMIGLGLAAGSALAGRPAPGLAALAASVAAALVGVVLLLPWSIDTLASRTATFGVGLGPSSRLPLADLLRFHTGPIGAGVAAWGLLAAAALPLLIGRSWRLAWASRLWGVAISCWLTAWAAGRGWLPIPMPAPEVFLAPAAAALSLSVALGAVAFKVDLPGYRLGWRQLASVVAAAGVALGALPILAAATNGRWHLPRRSFSGTLAAVPNRASDGAFRVLWIGDPRALPLGSWQLDPGVGFATSDDGPPDVSSLWPPRGAGATPQLAGDLRLAEARQTTRLGHLLAPASVRYIVVPSQSAPAGSGGSAVPVPNAILAALGQQTDLRSTPLDDALTAYENAAWTPGRAVLPPVATDASRSSGPSAGQSAELTGAAQVLPGGGPLSFRGPVPGSAEVLVAATDDAGWHLSVAGRGAPRRRAFGWAMAFDTAGGGKATLGYATPIGWHVVSMVEVGLWLAALRMVAVNRRRRAQLDGQGGSASPKPAPTPVEADRLVVGGPDGPRRPRRVTEPVAVGDSEELWL